MRIYIQTNLIIYLMPKSFRIKFKLIDSGIKFIIVRIIKLVTAI